MRARRECRASRPDPPAHNRGAARKPRHWPGRKLRISSVAAAGPRAAPLHLRQSDTGRLCSRSCYSSRPPPAFPPRSPRPPTRPRPWPPTPRARASSSRGGARPPPTSRGSRPPWFGSTACSTSRPGRRPPGSPASASTSRWTAGPPRSRPRCWSGTRPTPSTSASSPTTSEPGAIRATVADRDNIDNDDHVVIYLDTFNDRRRAFFFAREPARRPEDGVPERGHRPGAAASSPAAPTTTPTSSGSPRAGSPTRGYVVEIRIPFKSLRYPAAGRRAGASTSPAWSSAPATTTPGPTCAGPTPASSPRPARSAGCTTSSAACVVEAQPFVTATANGAARGQRAVRPRERQPRRRRSTCGSGFTNYALDATDQSRLQPGGDRRRAGDVNERFALFFPEKRPFFLEGIELFATPQTSWSTPAGSWTRRPAPSSPASSAQLGRRAPHGGGRDAATGDAWFNITRLRRDFGRNSIAGADLHRPRPGRQPQPRARRRLPLRLGASTTSQVQYGALVHPRRGREPDRPDLAG